MRGHILLAAALLAAPAHANDTSNSLSDEQRAVTAGVDAFFDALRSDDKTELAGTMHADGLIYIHNRMEEGNWQVQLRTTADHLENWLSSPTGLDETMVYETVLVDGDMALVWGPYSFHAGDTVVHCGINSMSMVKAGDGSWKVGNVSFSMVPPSQCATVGADWVANDDN
ncbi:DUF4440 domain-containing protein [Qipengyuania aquimaris]|uniref:Nuclear transport factor 2 family protein n=1 Tax=Qipengyuania aquimaris TaxID=255984 RepID=A0A9Q3RYV4_9SPHN|nr:DUF4440 domain-containing protein [Qipengyuania aquimaris]MBY6216927.1 nuclear transport factor 2 family protein [Qipengyuania aquimaris]